MLIKNTFPNYVLVLVFFVFSSLIMSEFENGIVLVYMHPV